MRTLKLLIFFFFISATAIAQQKIPFKLTDYNNLSIKSILNKRDTVNLMFHTAANAVTLTEEALLKISSLKFERTDSVKSWGGNDNTSRFSKSNLIEIGSNKWENVPIWENKNSGQQTDGKFGLDFFEGKTIELDFEKNSLLVHQALPNKTKRYQKLKISFEDEMMFVTGTIKIGSNSYKNKFLIHSGYAGAVLLDDQFVAKNKLADQLIITDEKQLKDSFGNVLKTKKAILPSFALTNVTLKNVSVGFFEGAIGRQKYSILGGDVLKRFNIVIDNKREFIYLKSNKFSNSPYLNI